MQPVVIYVRTTAVLKAALEQRASANGRTLNSEVVQILRRSVDGYSQDLRR